MDSIFLEKFSLKDKKLLDEYFKKLNSCISLSKKDTKLLNDDFQQAILYFYNHKKSIKIILKILSLDHLGDCYKTIPSNWYPLDNSAKIYPLSMKENWMSVYRLSYYFTEPIIPEIMQVALDFTMKRFPTFRTSIRKGFFWHYIDGIKKRFTLVEEHELPCSYINVSKFGKPSFKTLYYKNRLSVEFFHILTDGYGGITFISTLVATYLRLLGQDISYNDIVLNIDDTYTIDEVSDQFIINSNSCKKQSLVEGKAIQIDGKLSNIKPAQIVSFDIMLSELKEASKKYNATITEFILSLIFITLLHSSSMNGKIKIQLPVNMRKYYSSKTLRNFSLYIVISLDRKDITTIENVVIEVKKQMLEKSNINYLNGIMLYSKKLVKSIRWIPLFIKKPIASIIYGFLGEKAMTTVVSNLGIINIPSSMAKHLEKMDFVLGTSVTNKALFSLITINDVVTLSITKYTNNTSVENILYGLFKDNDIMVKVSGSEQYENSK